MNEDTQRRIWTRFYKGDSSRGKDKQGTGLGLAITKEIVTLHDGVVRCESEKEEITFVITLPMR